MTDAGARPGFRRHGESDGQVGGGGDLSNASTELPEAGTPTVVPPRFGGTRAWATVTRLLSVFDACLL